MTPDTLDGTGAALLAACVANPDELTVALEYADYLQEQGDDARAEFVRVQCELERNGRVCPFTLHHPEHILTDPHKKYVVPPRIEPRRPCGWCPVCLAVARERDLLRRHEAEWLRAGPCPECGGEGATGYSEGRLRKACPACFGTGDRGRLLELRVPENTGDSVYRYPVHFRRGLLDRVEVPTLGDCFEQPICTNCQGTGRNPNGVGNSCFYCSDTGLAPDWQPTPWLRAVVTGHPTVTAVVPLDRVPVLMTHAGKNGYEWCRAQGVASVETVGSFLPAKLFGALVGGEFYKATPGEYIAYPTREAAVAALGGAVVTVARKAVTA